MAEFSSDMDLYALYGSFMCDLNEDGAKTGEDFIRSMTRPEFERWLSKLPDEIRTANTADFLKGYRQAIVDGQAVARRVSGGKKKE